MDRIEHSISQPRNVSSDKFIFQKTKSFLNEPIGDLKFDSKPLSLNTEFIDRISQKLTDSHISKDNKTLQTITNLQSGSDSESSSSSPLHDHLNAISKSYKNNKKFIKPASTSIKKTIIIDLHRLIFNLKKLMILLVSNSTILPYMNGTSTV